MRVTNDSRKNAIGLSTCNGSGQIWTKPAEADCKDDY
jgi:hypothetical protein